MSLHLEQPGLANPEDGPVSEGTGTAVEIDEVLEDVEVVAIDAWVPPERPSVLKNPFRFLMWTVKIAVGLVSLIVLLAILAAVPILNFVALGMLLDAEGRVARTGRIRDGFPLLGVAGRLGTILLWIWLWMLPLRLLSFIRDDARIVSPESGAHGALAVITVVLAIGITLHLCLALAGGARPSCFFRPFRNIKRFRQRLRDGNFWSVARHQIVRLFHRLSWRKHFWLGLRGFVGAFVWLLIPTALLASSRATEGPGPLLILLGGILLIPVLCVLPILQARFAAEQRMSVFREYRTIKEIGRRRPTLWAIAIVVTLVMTFPLYLGKIKLPPRDAAWLLTVIFIGMIYPSRLLCGWAYYRASQLKQKASKYWLWPTRAAIIPLLLAYAVLLFLTPFIDEHGRLALFEHHAFLLPVPF